MTAQELIDKLIFLPKDTEILFRDLDHKHYNISTGISAQGFFIAKQLKASKETK